MSESKSGGGGTVVGCVDPTPEALRHALRVVPRDGFISAVGGCLPFAVGRSTPSTPAVEGMLGALRLQPGCSLLQVGTGSGYTAAVASEIAGSVYTIERLQPLAELAATRLAALGYHKVTVRHGNGAEGWTEHAPFDCILVAATGIDAPLALLQQLAVGGVLVTIVGPVRSRQRLVRVTRTQAEQFVREELGPLGLADDMTLSLAEISAPAANATLAPEAQAEVAIELAETGEGEAYHALAEQHGLPLGDLDLLLADIDIDVFEAVPRAFLDHHQVLPLRRVGNSVVVATSDPEANPEMLGHAFPGTQIELHLVPPSMLRRIWTTLEILAARAQRAPGVEDVPVNPEMLYQGVTDEDAGYVQLFDMILTDAIAERASDVHLERYGIRVVVRFRVDGELRNSPRFHLSPTELVGIVNVIKIRANLDIAERRLPQGGRIHLTASDQPFDVRVQTQPSLYGEHVVMRLLPQQKQILGIGDLGFTPAMGTHYRRLLEHPAGLILVVGPTGSGKSTTLYAGLQHLASDDTRKIITAEDPIEYSIDGIQQTQIRPGIGFAFADAMRAFVREDPDVILMGEVRDGETALEAVRASQTGHLVLSTLHCNDSVDAVQRLVDLGLHRNSIASELLAILAQRLVRRICEGCRHQVDAPAELLAELFPAGAPTDFQCFAGAGCESCGGHGTYGRVAVYELLPANPDLRRAIAEQMSVDDLRALAETAGMVSMRQSALRHVTAGRIQITDLPRILPAERLAPGLASPT